MRIAMLCSNHRVDDARVTRKQAVSLAKGGHHVCVFGLEGDPRTDLPGVRLHPVSPFKIGVRARLSIAPKLLGPVLRWKPDIVVGHEPETAALGLYIRSKTGVRVVFDVHELWHETMALRAPTVIRAAARWGFAAALRSIARRCDWVTVVSPWNFEFFRQVRCDGRVTIIHNSPPPELFPPCQQPASGPVRIVHEGSLSENRGMLQILDALALARAEADVRLLIVGGIRAGQQALFERTAAKLGLTAAIESLGWVPYEQVGRHSRRAQIGIVAMQPTVNNYLSLSNKIYSYMCCAQPAIVPVGSATEDLVREADCGLAVDTTEPQQIARAILRLAKDRSLRERLGANGRKAIEDTYGWHKMEEKLARIYAALR
jgi:glycosyltransferase involved in cell wall biosynthesis